ncbi:MAG: efflux transporter outer membrane subunit [Verrucomicrobiales bacterium]|nr:efflux transporter outer membrane subunit [Verrucomicrobiales bacterium]
MHRSYYLLVGCFLCGCQALPPGLRTSEVGLETPNLWSSTKAARAGVDQAWLERFRDPTLKRLANEAVENNPDLKAAASRVRVAASNAKIAGAARRPQLNAVLSGNRRKTNFIGFPDFGGFDEGSRGGEPSVISTISDTFGASLDLSWEADLWGRIRAGESAALAELQATDADYRAARSSLVAQVAKAWFALTEASQQLALAEEAVKAFQSTEDVIADRFEIGELEGGGTGAQLRLAKSDVASAREQVAQRKDLLQQAKRQLEVLLGRYPKNLLAGNPELPHLPGRPPTGLPSELLLRRPDIQAAERRFASQGQRITEARLAMFPQLKMTASGGTSTDSLKDLLDSDFGVWNLAGNIVQSILTGGQLLAEKRVREEQESQALAALQSTVLQGFLEVELALEADQYLAERQSALEDATALSREAYIASRADYRDGVGDILTVLAAQSRALQFSGQLISIRRLRLDNRVNLHLALGGDFKPNHPKP